MVLFQTYSSIKKESDLGDLIMKGLHTTEKQNRNGRLYPSDSAFCELKSILSSSYIGERESDGLKEYYTESGKTSEKVSLKGLDNSGVLLYADYKLPDIGLNLGGYVDGIIHYDNKIYVLELKQIGTLPTSVDKQHESQAVFYSAVLGLPAIILYIDRKVSGMTRDLLRKEFVLDTSYDNRFKFTLNVVKSQLLNDSKLIPSKPLQLKKTHCKNCDWFSKCYEDDEDYDNWLNQGFRFATASELLEIENESKLVVDKLLNPTIMKDRTTGVLKFLSEHGRDNAKKLLVGKSWHNYYE